MPWSRTNPLEERVKFVLEWEKRWSAGEGRMSLSELCDAVWCVDFKGWVRTGDGRRCYPLTLIDVYSRYLLRCEAPLDPDTRHVEPTTSAPTRRSTSSRR
jgi:transposase InsO family protein